MGLFTDKCAALTRYHEGKGHIFEDCLRFQQLKVLENKAGLEFSILSNLRLMEIRSKIELEFGLLSILELKQSESKMEQYFRYKAMEIPKEE